MTYKRSLIDILQEVHSSLDASISILDVATTDNTHVLTVEDIKYAQPGFKVTIDDEEYLITDIDADDNTITVTGTEPIVAAIFYLYDTYFFHGTPIEQGAELNDVKEAKDKTPMIWLLETFTERFIEDEIDPIERESEVRIFALTQANFRDFTTSEAYRLYIGPMRRLMEMFTDIMRRNMRVFDMNDTSFRVINYPKFGVYISNKGVEKSMFNDKLSGIEQPMELRIWKDDDCNGCGKGEGINFMEISKDFIVE